MGLELVLECGPGKVLSGLVKRIDRTLNTISVYDTISLEQVRAVCISHANNPHYYLVY